MKNIGLFYVLLIMITVGCRSPKPVVAKKELSKKQQKEYKALSQKLSLAIDREDNIKLYQFIAGWLHVPHQLGKCTKLGVDCSCFIRLVYQEVYAQDIPRTSTEMHDLSKRLAKRALQEGDVVFFSIQSKKVSHVGVYLKDGWFAHVSTSKGVIINNLSEKYYAQYYTGAGRF
jgi:lipoprotein Spr